MVRVGGGSVVEPRLRRSSGAARESQSPVPDSRNDGARQTDHHASEAGQQRVPRERDSGTEVLRPVQAVRGTAVEAGRQRSEAFTSHHSFRLVLSRLALSYLTSLHLN